jgi:hypothetical protein
MRDCQIDFKITVHWSSPSGLEHTALLSRTNPISVIKNTSHDQSAKVVKPREKFSYNVSSMMKIPMTFFNRLSTRGVIANPCDNGLSRRYVIISMGEVGNQLASLLQWSSHLSKALKRDKAMDTIQLLHRLYAPIRKPSKPRHTAWQTTPPFVARMGATWERPTSDR